MLALVIGNICGFFDQPDASVKEGSRRVVGGIVSDTWMGPFWVGVEGVVEVKSGIRSLAGLVAWDGDGRSWMLMDFRKTSTEYWLSIL